MFSRKMFKVFDKNNFNEQTILPYMLVHLVNNGVDISKIKNFIYMPEEIIRIVKRGIVVRIAIDIDVSISDYGKMCLDELKKELAANVIDCSIERCIVHNIEVIFFIAEESVIDEKSESKVLFYYMKPHNKRLI